MDPAEVHTACSQPGEPQHAGWNSLPSDVKWCILSKAVASGILVDLGALRLVCTEWRDIMRGAVRSLSPTRWTSEFATFPLHSLDLSRGSADITAGLLREICSASTEVHTLNLGFCNQLGDGGLQACLSDAAPLSLRALDLHQCRHPAIAACTLLPLTSLDLSSCPWVEDHTLLIMATISSIRSLRLRSCPFPGDALAALGGLPSLQELDVSGCHRLVDASMPLLAALTGLTALRCAALRNVSSEGYGALAALPALRLLDLSESKHLDNAGAAPLAGLTTVRSLSLRDCYKVTGSGLVALAPLSSLTSLHVGGCLISYPRGIEHLAAFSRLQHLSLCGSSHFNASVSGPRLELLAAICPALRHLDISHNRPLADLSAMHAFARPRLADLTSLSLAGNTNLGDAHLSELACVSRLQCLDLSYLFKLGDAGVRHLSSLSQLTQLSLAGCSRVGDDALPHIAALQQLAALDLHHTSVTHHGLAASLAAMACLDLLDVRACSGVTTLSELPYAVRRAIGSRHSVLRDPGVHAVGPGRPGSAPPHSSDGAGRRVKAGTA